MQRPLKARILISAPPVERERVVENTFFCGLRTQGPPPEAEPYDLRHETKLSLFT